MAENPYASTSNNIVAISTKEENSRWQKRLFKENRQGGHSKNLVGMVNLHENKIKRTVRVSAASGSRSPNNADVLKKVPRLPALGSEISSDGGQENDSRRRGLSRDASHQLSMSNS